MNPKHIFKMLRVAGVRVKFDAARELLVISTDSSSQEHRFSDIEALVNGDDSKSGS